MLLSVKIREAQAIAEEKGMEKGMEKGISEKTRIVITNMLNRGMTGDDIMAIAECTLADIETLTALHAEAAAGSQFE